MGDQAVAAERFLALDARQLSRRLRLELGLLFGGLLVEGLGPVQVDPKLVFAGQIISQGVVRQSHVDEQRGRRLVGLSTQATVHQV